MSQKPGRGVFELEIDFFDQHVDGQERFAPSPLAQDRGVVTDAEDQVLFGVGGGASFRRLVANAFYEVELALHLSRRVELLIGPLIRPFPRSNIVFLDQQIQRLSNQRRFIKIYAEIRFSLPSQYLQSPCL